MASARKDSKKQLVAKLRKIENDLVMAQEKVYSLTKQFKEAKDVYDTAVNNVDNALKERDYKISREQREYEWKSKFISWNDSNKRDVKSLSEQVDYLKDKLVNQDRPRITPKYSGTTMIKRVVIYGFGLTFGLAMGLTMTAMPN